jgi:hypothetical protein
LKQTLLNRRTRLCRSESTHIRRQNTQVRVQSSILTQYGSVAATADDCAQEAASSIARCSTLSTVAAEDCDALDLTGIVTGSVRDTAVANVIDEAASNAEAASAAAANVCVTTEADMPMTESGKRQGQDDVRDDIVAHSCACSADEGQATALRSQTISGASASQLRHDLVDWSFDPFTADSLKKCRMIEAMFQTLGLSQVLNQAIT